MLQVGFRLTNGPAASSATTPHRLFLWTLDPGPRRILLAELLGLLLPPGRRQRLVLLTGQQPEDPGLLLRSRALGPQRARRAILPREAGLEGHSTLGIGI